MPFSRVLEDLNLLLRPIGQAASSTNGFEHTFWWEDSNFHPTHSNRHILLHQALETIYGTYHRDKRMIMEG